jgi:predicted DCC family thiol-disulfide oxidoreductase YuxK
METLADRNDSSSDAPEDGVTLIYDGQCPVCTAYSCSVETEGAGIRRVDARSDDRDVAQATAAGFDLDEGMIAIHRGKRYYGADALHLMATLAPAKGLRNRLNRAMFGSRTATRMLYPVLRAGRNTLLKLLGRKKIRNLDRAS